MSLLEMVMILADFGGKRQRGDNRQKNERISLLPKTIRYRYNKTGDTRTHTFFWQISHLYFYRGSRAAAAAAEAAAARAAFSKDAAD